VEHVAGIPVRNPGAVELGRHYGLTVATCVPYDPASKGGSESDMGMTAHHAVIAVGGVRAGLKVGIIGLGGLGATTAGAIEIIGAGGRIVQVGLGRVEATINTSALCTKELTPVGSLAGDKPDVPAVLGYIAAG
jgi:threonine dehydrogenase-like Zn-dependent dehydrogenase